MISRFYHFLFGCLTLLRVPWRAKSREQPSRVHHSTLCGGNRHLRGKGHCYDTSWRCIFCGHRPPPAERVGWGKP